MLGRDSIFATTTGYTLLGGPVPNASANALDASFTSFFPSLRALPTVSKLVGLTIITNFIPCE